MYFGNTARTNWSNQASHELRNYLKLFVSRAIEANPHAGLRTISKIVREESGKGSYSTVQSMYQAELSRRTQQKKAQEAQT